MVATCHSEFVGKIFQQAGAKHVICINQSEEVDDEAVITFTETFYNMLLEHNMKICGAFLQAQNVVSIKHGYEQANIFKLLLSDDEQLERRNSKRKKSIRSLHNCSTFGPF